MGGDGARAGLETGRGRLELLFPLWDPGRAQVGGNRRSCFVRIDDLPRQEATSVVLVRSDGGAPCSSCQSTSSRQGSTPSEPAAESLNRALPLSCFGLPSQTRARCGDPPK